jgi:hypothetical protein
MLFPPRRDQISPEKPLVLGGVATMANDLEIGATVTPIPFSGSPAAKKYTATIHHDEPISAEFAETIFEIEKALELKLWLLIQNGEEQHDDIGRAVYNGFRNAKTEIGKNERVGLLIHSPGGNASYAYKIIRLFQRRTDAFHTIVPLYAKSAATLMAIGGRELILGLDAELGPLDVQIYDEDKEDYDSALNAVQSLERLNAYALTALDQAMQLLLARMRKRADILLPTALQYASGIVKPLAEKLDTIEITRKSRELKVAEDYAVRLMRPHYTERDSKRIASDLVERYSAHEFVIDSQEAGKGGKGPRMPSNLGLNITLASEDVEGMFCKIVPYLERATIIGRITEEQS